MALEDLLTRLRSMIHDPASVDQVFSDDDLETILAGKEISTGTYDLHGAAADALEEWAAKVALQVDFQADGASYRLSQKQEALLRLAERHRRQQSPTTVTMARGDIAGEESL